MEMAIVVAFLTVFFGGIGFFVGVLRRANRRWRYALLGLAAGICVVSPWVWADGQEVVHARTGQVTAVNLASKTLVLKLADGSILIFNDVAGHEPALTFDKAVRQKTVPVATYTRVGSNVVVFYYGYDTLTAVAIKELGTDPLKRSTGSLANFDRHEHSLLLKTDAAEPQKLALNEDTVVDTSDGVVKLADYKPARGTQLRCVTKPESQVALLVAPQ